jgi:hypothetical protein
MAATKQLNTWRIAIASAVPVREAALNDPTEACRPAPRAKEGRSEFVDGHPDTRKRAGGLGGQEAADVVGEQLE